MGTFHIHIAGIVQGVGFRPFVYQLASKHGLFGWVNNTNNGVHIEFSTEQDVANSFYHEIITNPPKLATITIHEIQKITAKTFTQFEIIESDNGASPSLPLTPDFALCEDCRDEISNKTDRRHNYAFTTCTNCGPRYSIITALPYDRPNTTMAKFEQCEECNSEYNNPFNRRHYSQTNSCEACGVQLMVGKENITITDIVNHLEQQKIIAIKGIGGFLLMCNAGNKEVIELLRHRKNRPTKPFAIMYPDLEMIKADFDVIEEAEQLFLNEVSPIILLRPISDNLSIDKAAVAPGLNHLGCMVPYAPLFQLILQEYGKPVIATSGNISGSPIIYENKEAEEELSGIADLIITNNRDIVVPQDDSVIKFSDQSLSGQQKIILRRSRGLAPTFLDPGIELPDKNILAVGAQMKSSFAFTNKRQLYVSQYLGDMDNYLTQQHYENTIDHFFKVFDAHPQVIIGDKHPDYFSTQFGEELATKLNVPFLQVQHHEAHFYAVLAENNLLDDTDHTLGVIWDGTGYGDDGQIWGGEFFLYKEGQTERVVHIPYFPFILGNKMAKEPRVSALAFGSLGDDNKYLNTLKDKFSASEWDVYQKMLAEPPLRTSSMGRVFDAMASIILAINKTSFEGEAAMMLEAAASAYFSTHPINVACTYNYNQDKNHNLFADLFNFVIEDKKKGISNSEIAAKFHLSLVNLIRHEAEKQGVKKIAFSGGVFQNSLLVDLIKTILSNDYELIFHNRLSSNDENISYGQLAYYIMHENKIL